MPEPLTFRVTDYPGPYNMPPALACVAKRRGLRVTPSRPIVAADFADFGQRCDLGLLGYSSRDFRPEPAPKWVTDEQTLTTAYHALGLKRRDEYERIALASEGTNGIRVEIYEERVNALDEAVLEVYRRRAVV